MTSRPRRTSWMIDGMPIILLYSAAFAKNHDQSVVDYLRAKFPKQFGGRVLWLAREVSWNVRSVSVALGATNRESGLRQVENEDDLS